MAPRAAWMLPGGRSGPVINSTANHHKHQPIGSPEPHMGSTNPRPRRANRSQPRQKFAYGNVKEIENSRSSRQKRDVHLRSLERSMLRKFEAEELAKLNTEHLNSQQQLHAKSQAHRAAVLRTKQWRDDVESGRIEIPWDFVETSSVGSEYQTPIKKVPHKSPRNDSRRGPRDSPAKGGAGRRVRKGGSAWAGTGDIPGRFPSDAEQVSEPRFHLSRAHVEIIFDEIDLDHNGSVATEELLTAIQTNPVVQEILGFGENMTPAQEAKFAELFSLIDENHDEQISLAEFESYLLGQGGVEVSNESHMSAQERELRNELADMQLKLLAKQHELADIVHRTIDVLPAERVKMDAIRKLRDEESRLLDAYAYLVKQLQTVEASK